MNFTSAEWILIITTIFTGIVSIIGAIKTNTGNRTIGETNVKTDAVKAKIDEVHQVTNGRLTLITEENKRLEDELARARADLIALGQRKRDGI